jgi:hypothetical protein
MIHDLTPSVSDFPLIPTGSLIRSNSKFGHELIAGPLVNNKQTVLHKEQNVGVHMEPMDEAAQRYPFAEIIPPVSIEHGLESWRRMEQQVHRPWTLLDNCQHAARHAYYGRAYSPAVNNAAVVCVLALLIFGSQD